MNLRRTTAVSPDLDEPTPILVPANDDDPRTDAIEAWTQRMRIRAELTFVVGAGLLFAVLVLLVGINLWRLA